MNIIHLKIPSRIIIEKQIKFQDGIFCFNSKKEKALDFYCHYIGLIIDIDLHSNYSRVISEFVTTLNIFRQEYVAIQWLSNLNYNQFIVNTNQDIFEYIHAHQNNIIEYICTENFDRFQVQILGNSSIYYSFIDVFNELVKINKDSFIHNSLSYLAISNSIIMTTNRVYDNVFFENSLLFQLFEAIMSNYESKYTCEIRSCGECKKEIKIGLNMRIERFLKEIKVIDPKYIKAVKVLAKTRHKFFHSLHGLSQKDHFEKVIQEVGNNFISFNDELTYAGGAMLGKGILKQIITTYLLENLLTKDI